MRISKSLFVEFGRSPKAARFYINDKEKYQVIREDRYGSMDGAAIGDSVENIVLELLTKQGYRIGNPSGKFSARAQTTQQLLEADHIEAIVQGRFQTDALLCATDVLVKNKE